MKKGFTLIEIIVCIALLGILGVSSILIVNKKANNELEEITKKVLEAANVFVEMEKDENGNNYLEEISKGAKGVQIPISMLIDKGYIKEDLVDDIYNLKRESKQDNKSYYVIFLGDGEDYCNKEQITITSSWMDKDKTFYLCKNYTSGGGGYPPNTLYGRIVKEYEENGISGCIPGEENGLCYYKNNGKTNNNVGVYYYTGEVNNIIQIDGEKFYIVRTTEDGGVKILKKETINFGGITVGSSNYALVNPDGTKNHIYPSDYLVSIKSKTRLIYGYDNDSKSYIASLITVNGAQANGIGCWAQYKLSGENDSYSWSDPTQYEYKTDGDCYKDGLNNFSVSSEIYTHIYLPVENWYNEKEEIYNKLVKEDYEWCAASNYKAYIKSQILYYSKIPFPVVDFTCRDEKYIQTTKFGLLTLAEYSAIVKRIYQSGNGLAIAGFHMFDQTYYGDEGHDIIFDYRYYNNVTSAILYPYDSDGIDDFTYPKIRPALVLKGDLIVEEGGTGTKENPYVLKID